MLILFPIVLFFLFLRFPKRIGFFTACLGILFLEAFSPFPFGVELIAVFAGFFLVYWLRSIIEEQYTTHSAVILCGGVWGYVIVKTFLLALFIFGPVSHFFPAVLVRGGLEFVEYTVFTIAFLSLLLAGNYIIYALAFRKKI